MPRNYKEIEEKGSWMRNKPLKDVFEGLSVMPANEIKARMEEIQDTLSEIEKEAFRKQRVLSKKGNISEEENKEIVELQEYADRLENELEILNYLPGIGYVLQKIENERVELISRRTEEAEKAKKIIEKAKAKATEATAKAEEAKEKDKEAKAKLEEAKTKAEEARKKLERIAELEKSIIELSEKMSSFDNFPDIQNLIIEKVKTLGDEKKALGEKDELEAVIKAEEETKKNTEKVAKKLSRAEAKEAEAKKQVETAEKEAENMVNGNSLLNEAIERCENPWDKILKGYGWEEIATLGDDEIKSLIEAPEEKKAGKPESEKASESTSKTETETEPTQSKEPKQARNSCLRNKPRTDNRTRTNS